MSDSKIAKRTFALRYLFGMLFVGISLTSHPIDSYAAEAVAMVTDIVGTGVITENGEEKPCEILAYLPPGAEVRINEGTNLSLVYFQSAQEYAFSGKANIRINPEEPQVLSGTNPQSRNLALVGETGLLPSARHGYTQVALVLRSTGKKKKKIRLIDPRDTKVLDAHPVFRWEPLEDGVQYRFVLADESGRTVMETLVNDTSFQAPPELWLEEGVIYTWQVEARLASGVVYLSSAEFSLLEKSERDQINKLRPAANAPFSERLLFATLLDELDLRDAAQRQWNALAAERPNAKPLQAKVMK